MLAILRALLVLGTVWAYVHWVHGSGKHQTQRHKYRASDRVVNVGVSAGTSCTGYSVGMSAVTKCSRDNKRTCALGICALRPVYRQSINRRVYVAESRASFATGTASIDSL